MQSRWTRSAEVPGVLHELAARAIEKGDRDVILVPGVGTTALCIAAGGGRWGCKADLPSLIRAGATGGDDIEKAAKVAIQRVLETKIDRSKEGRQIGREVDAVGFSRGAISATLFGHFAQSLPMVSLGRLVLLDPVPGPTRTDAGTFSAFKGSQWRRLPPAEKKALVLYAEHMPGRLFRAVFPCEWTDDERCRRSAEFDIMPGQHDSLVSYDMPGDGIVAKQTFLRVAFALGLRDDFPFSTDRRLAAMKTALNQLDETMENYAKIADRWDDFIADVPASETCRRLKAWDPVGRLGRVCAASPEGFRRALEEAERLGPSNDVTRKLRETWKKWMKSYQEEGKAAAGDRPDCKKSFRDVSVSLGEALDRTSRESNRVRPDPTIGETVKAIGDLLASSRTSERPPPMYHLDPNEAIRSLEREERLAVGKDNPPACPDHMRGFLKTWKFVNLEHERFAQATKTLTAEENKQRMMESTARKEERSPQTGPSGGVPAFPFGFGARGQSRE